MQEHWKQMYYTWYQKLHLDPPQHLLLALAGRVVACMASLISYRERSVWLGGLQNKS